MKTQIVVRSYPKVNLALDVLRRTESGYHEIQTVFYQLSEPCDEIILESALDGILEINSDCSELPCDETNTVYKAAHLLQQHAKISHGAKIFIKKRIPIMAGLGGGSSNAVAALKGLAKFWKIPCCAGFPNIVDVSPFVPGHKLKNKTATRQTAGDFRHADTCLLRPLVNQIGMDCAFFFDVPAPAAAMPGLHAALGTHFGEKITPLPPLPKNLYAEIIETGVEISTRTAYENLDLSSCGKNLKKTGCLIEGLRECNPQKILRNIHNDFEESVFTAYPELLNKKHELQKTYGNKTARILLCGSGGALVSVFYKNALVTLGF